MHQSCEFCAEIIGTVESRFHHLYHSHLKSRIVLKTASFVVLPTIGQLFKGSLLIIPLHHIETLSRLAQSEMNELENVLERAETKICSLGFPLVYEHGAQLCTASGCGIYHAHLHVIPLPRKLYCEELPLGDSCVAPSLSAALSQLDTAKQYLLCRDSGNAVRYVLPAGSDDLRFRSQFMRKTLAAVFGLGGDWDWRSYDRPEPWLIDTVRLFGDVKCS